MKQWNSVDGKQGIYVHDDAPACEVEIIFYACQGCGNQQTTMHAAHDCDSHTTATERERIEHALCRCGQQMSKVQ